MRRNPDPGAATDRSIAARAHIPALDGLRGLAILLVIPHNADIFSNSAPWLWPMAQLAHAGWIGVQLFFVLSGFLITRNLLDTRHDENYFKVFYGRRVLRIFPLYFLTLFVGLVLLPRLVHFGPEALAGHARNDREWIGVLPDPAQICHLAVTKDGTRQRLHLGGIELVFYPIDAGNKGRAAAERVGTQAQQADDVGRKLGVAKIGVRELQPDALRPVGWALRVGAQAAPMPGVVLVDAEG